MSHILTMFDILLAILFLIILLEPAIHPANFDKVTGQPVEDNRDTFQFWIGFIFLVAHLAINF